MGEMLRNIVVLVWVASAINNTSYAAETDLNIQEEANKNSPTIIMGAAKTSEGNTEEDIVIQYNQNILGEPIPEYIDNSENKQEDDKPVKTPEDNSATETKPIPEGDFQNTLMEANGMVYDVQAFPETDIPVISNPSNPKTIYSPNVNP